jgi:hypothetical protein
MEEAKTLVLNIGEDPHRLHYGKGGSGSDDIPIAVLDNYVKKEELADELENYIDVGKLNDTLLNYPTTSTVSTTYLSKADASANYVKLADIANDLETLDPTKVLGASQGAELKAQIDILRADLAKIMGEGIGIAAGLGVRITAVENLAMIQIDIDENSPLAFDENDRLTVEWSQYN